MIENASISDALIDVLVCTICKIQDSQSNY